MLETLLINGALAILLLATLFYAVKLDRRIGELRQGRAELDRAVARFAAAAAEADRTMARLAEMTNGQGRALQDAVKKGGGIADDLKFLTERAETAADRLEAAVARSRGPRLQPAAPAARPTMPAAAADAAAELPESERKLLKALAGLR